MRLSHRRFQEIIHDFSSPTESSQLGRPSSMRERTAARDPGMHNPALFVHSLQLRCSFACITVSTTFASFTLQNCCLQAIPKNCTRCSLHMKTPEHHVQTRFQVPDEVLASEMAVVPFTSTSVSTSNYSMLQPAPTLLLLPVVSCCCCSSGIRL